MSKIRGFYYDQQMSNITNVVTLHPSTRPFKDKDGQIQWDKAESGKVDSKDDEIIRWLKEDSSGRDYIRHYDKEWDEYLTSGFTMDTDGKKNDGLLAKINDSDEFQYFAEPICTSLFTEDFNFSVQNDWGTFSGGNAIEDMFNSLKGYAPLAGTIGDAAKTIGGKLKKNKGFGSSIAGFLETGADWVEKGAKVMEKNLNRGLVVQGTKFLTYNGSSLSFGNMSMKFTILSDWRELYPRSGTSIKYTGYQFFTVMDQLKRILPYFIGMYHGASAGLRELAEDRLGIEDSEIIEAADKFINEMIGWQESPGGFKASYKSVDTTNQGTLRMMMGGYYTIDNLVIKNISVTMSRELCKNPNAYIKTPGSMEMLTDLGEVESFSRQPMVPLYADVTIDLQPATVYTDRRLLGLIGSHGMREIQAAIREKEKELEAAKKQAAEEAEEGKKKKQELQNSENRSVDKS